MNIVVRSDRRVESLASDIRRVVQSMDPTLPIINLRSMDEVFEETVAQPRFLVQLLGIYPPGNLVKLSTGETAVVLETHAPDPHRPRVRVIFHSDGTRLDTPQDRNLFDTSGDAAQSIVTPLDPADFGIDPLTLLS